MHYVAVTFFRSIDVQVIGLYRPSGAALRAQGVGRFGVGPGEIATAFGYLAVAAAGACSWRRWPCSRQADPALFIGTTDPLFDNNGELRERQFICYIDHVASTGMQGGYMKVLR